MKTTKKMLAGVTVGKKFDEGYANVELVKDGVVVGCINTQYQSCQIEGYGDGTICGSNIDCSNAPELLTSARQVLETARQAAEKAEIEKEKIAEEQAKINDAEYAQQLKNGLCPKCGTYCYGDCQAN